MPDVTLPRVLTLAVPAMAAGVLQSAFRPVDQFFIQDLGAPAQGALGATTLVSILAYALFQLVSAGIGPWVGRHTGANEIDDRRTAVEQSLGAAGVIALGLALCGWWITNPIVAFLGLTGEGAMHAEAYLRVLFITGPALAFSPTVDAIFHAMGDTRLPLRLQIGAVLLNILLTPLLVPMLGTAGAALGSTLSQTTATLIGLAVLTRRLDLDPRRCIPRDRIRGILEVGSPVAMATAMFAFVYWLLMATVIPTLGQDVYAGLGLGFGVLESVAWPLYSGLAIAAASLVSRALGADRPDLAWRAATRTLQLAVGVGASLSAVYGFAGPLIMDRFATDPAAYREGVRYAMILAIAQPLVAIEAVCEGVLGGAGDTRKLLWTNAPLNLARVPLAWLFAIGLGFGADGLWWAINLSTLLKCVIMAGLVLQGGWRYRVLSVTRESLG